MGAGDDSAHSQNEKIDVRNYIEGVSIKFSFKTPTTSMCFCRFLFIFVLCIIWLNNKKRLQYIIFFVSDQIDGSITL